MSEKSVESLGWKMDFDRRLIWRRGGSVRYLVVELAAKKEASRTEQQREPLNMALVVDASGSMSGPPLACATRAAAGVVAKLGEEDCLALVSFAEEPVVHLDSVRMDAQGRQRAIDLLEELRTRGSTNLAGGWLAGCECVARQEAALPAAGRVFLMSDGHANRGVQDPFQLAEIADNLRARRVFTSTVGIGNSYSPVQLEAIAEHGGGRLHDAETPDEIIEVVLGELGEVLTTVADDIQLELKIPEGVKAECLGSYPVSQHEHHLVVALGGLTGGSTRSVVVKFTSPAGDLESRLAIAGELSWIAPIEKERQRSQSLSASLRFARGEENSRQAPRR